MNIKHTEQRCEEISNKFNDYTTGINIGQYLSDKIRYSHLDDHYITKPTRK